MDKQFEGAWADRCRALTKAKWEHDGRDGLCPATAECPESGPLHCYHKKGTSRICCGCKGSLELAIALVLERDAREA